ncbi:ribosome biogenesis factor YjgA [Snodgrassella sp. CFCC 13594]|uniref:ribosome biogenesis factor YjgA n=1 Tax=Snodgrassella sp. CFCC 13594 TaxID=1775559 RepID=UPI0008344046|nr:ribosome biogenesis factor YjgA [Snodgrassella sp. CFCC 13594]
MSLTPFENDDADQWISKTQKKKQMDALQDLGVALTKLAPDTLKKIGLPEPLLQALLEHKKINSNSALKRQVQYIGRLMREVDPEPIALYLAKLRGDNQAHNAYMQRLEMLRERLIANDEALTILIDQHPQIDASTLRTLIRNARKEQAENKPPKAYRALFQQLRSQIDEHDVI